MDRLGMSLDDIAKQRNDAAKKDRMQNKKQGKGKGANLKKKVSKSNGGSSVALKTSPSRKVQTKTIVRPGMKRVSIRPLTKNNTMVITPSTVGVGSTIFNRIGAVGNSNASNGFSVTFSDLVSSVESSDLSELCSTVGQVREINLKVKPNGKGKLSKTADVVFASKRDALKCIENYNGVTLDGVRMKVDLTSSADNKNNGGSIFNRVGASNDNAKGRLFGTALRKQDNRRSDGPTFKVTLGQGQGSRKIRTQENQSKGNNTRKGRMNGGNKVKGGNKKRNNVSEADLDAEMDAYHGKDPTEAASANLNDDLDAYFQSR